MAHNPGPRDLSAALDGSMAAAIGKSSFGRHPAMADLRNKLPVACLLFTARGRISRSAYWQVAILLACSFYVLYTLLYHLAGPFSTWVIYPPFYWCVWATACKRLHDAGRPGWRLLALLAPVAGPLYIAFELFFRRGQREDNRFGPSPRAKADYQKNDDGIPHPSGVGWIINDVTGLNPVSVARVERPASVEELAELVRTTAGPISIGGGRFSMGGQTASPGSLHIDMRSLNQVLDISVAEKWIRVQAGIRWCDIQHQIDPHHLSIKIMQTYANFTVGGALSVNCHGRYVGLGPVILSVRAIRVLLMDGRLVRASRTENAEIFFGAIGCFSAIGIIVEAELDLADNVPVKLAQKKMERADYPAFFRKTIRGKPEAIFHNADMYPPDFTRLRSLTYCATSERPTAKDRLVPLRESYPIHRYFLWSFMETPFGAWRRENLIEPLFYMRPKIHWRNYEAGYDIMELEPASREKETWVLLEYFAPVARFEEFSRRMAEIFTRHRVRVLNISIRHATQDPGSYLAWAREEVFAFVVYYKQQTGEAEKGRVAVWTRELVDAVIAVGGTYYLPYQPRATPEQFHRVYPGARKLFALKGRLDPQFRLRNALWDKYYLPSTINRPTSMTTANAEFKTVFSDTKWSDAFYRFLQVVFHLYPEDKFHCLIAEVTKTGASDSAIYQEVQRRLPEIKPFASELTYALPALRKQKREMTRQTLELLGDVKCIHGYLEIGSTGRYISDLRKHIQVDGEIYLMNDTAPDNSPGEIFERGQLSKIGRFYDLNNYQPISAAQIPDESIDLVTLYIGFHHCPDELFPGFVKSIRRILRPNGSLILRDHNVQSAEMGVFVSLVHTVFNLGLKTPWNKNEKEYKHFRSMDEWCDLAAQEGFTSTGKRLYQPNDPSDNALVRLVRS